MKDIILNFYEENKILILIDFAINNGFSLDKDSLFEMEEEYYKEIMGLAEDWFREEEKK